MTKKDEQNYRDNLKRIKLLRLIDDDFMSIFFDGYIEGVELVLNVILNRNDVKIIDARTQKQLNNLNGRSIRLDIYAEDNTGSRYDVEIQRKNKGANPKRARYHSSMIDADMLKEGTNFEDLRGNYVIFITENDVFGLNKPAYFIESVFHETKVQFGDNRHIIYVNGSMRTKDTALGRLMSDFYCTDAKDMHYKELAERFRNFKETEKGVKYMCDVLDEMKNEAVERANIEHAKAMIKDGMLSLEKIAEYSGLSLDKIRELAGRQSA
ncbi:MAG: PD-(D/E)XK nuclease family transposase [Clostridiales bacterium]|nr:PD-(D/E)XK nuclease family transposase [Clostridiales bacterium]